MKTLLVSIYDGIYGGYSAVMLVDTDIVKTINLSKNLIREFDSATMQFSGSEERSVEFTKLLDEYNAVIVCNNGAIYKLK